MSNARNLARLIVDSGGDVEVSSLGNVPPSNDASALTTGTLGTARLPAGSVLQVVQNTNNTRTSWGDGAPDFDLMSASITPSSTSSTILVMGVLYLAWNPNGGMMLRRNGTAIGGAGGSFAGGSSDAFYVGDDFSNTSYQMLPLVFNYKDSPSSTSSVTYAFRTSSTDTGVFNGHSADSTARARSTITLIELAA